MFVNEQQLNIDGQRDARTAVLEEWITSGLPIGNHTYSHMNLRNVELPEYFDDVIKGETISRSLANKHEKDFIWFRYPYLATGRGDKAKAVEAFLAERNYQIAPVTVSYADYLYANNYSRFLRAGDNTKRDAEAQSVMKALDSAFENSEKQSQDLLGYELPLVLLIHCSEMNANILPESLQRMKDRGYEFVSLDQAMQDPAYQTPDLPAGSMGGSFFGGLSRLKSN